MKKNKLDKDNVNKCYWLVAGVLVGVYAVLMAYINLVIIKPDSEGVFSSLGIAIVIAQYTVFVYLLSRIQKR